MSRVMVCEHVVSYYVYMMVVVVVISGYRV